MKKWRCTVCGYIHEGEEPPDECPVCGADKSLFEEVPAEKPSATSEAAGEPAPEKPEAAAPAAPTADDNFKESAAASGPARKEDKLSEMIVKHHVHPMTVHIPNGVLPITVLFLFIALVFGCTALETAAICNMTIIFLAMPAVLYTGYKNWQYKYKGARTDLFFTKIICGAVVTGLSVFLLLWWIIAPDVASGGGRAGWIFLLLHLIMLLFAVIAGLMGGRLVFREK